MLDELKRRGFEVRFESHAAAILDGHFPQALADIETALVGVQIPITEIIASGGGEHPATQRLRRALKVLGWDKYHYEIKKTINGVPHESISHEVDHRKIFEGEFEGNKEIALEIEWNNKDPFFDRDLENFKRLHAEGAISVGVIVTRGALLHQSMRDFVSRFAGEFNIDSFDDLLATADLLPTRRQKGQVDKKMAGGKKSFAAAWTEVFVPDKYGEATTHWRKLMDRVTRGVGNPCPLLLIGLPAGVVTFDRAAIAAAEPAGAEEEEEEIGR
jgi:hypothetical protein